MDKSLYLDVNRFAAKSHWLHPVATFLTGPGGLLLLAVLVFIAYLQARNGDLGGSDLDQLAAVVWVVLGTALAYLLVLPVVHLVARARPFTELPTAVVLGRRPTGFGFPNEHAVVAWAVAAGLWCARTRLVAFLATLLALAICYFEVYVGAAYPSDVVVGALIGIAVILIGYPLVLPSLRRLAHAMARGPLRLLVGTHGPTRTRGLGPAAVPVPVGESGGVRILRKEEVGPAPSAARPPDGAAAEEAEAQEASAD